MQSVPFLPSRPASGEQHVSKPSAESYVVLALLIGTALLLPAMVAIVAHQTGGAFSGAEGLYAPDQFQYLAWIRDSGEHFFPGDLFDVPAGNRVFLHPMWLLSGLLWRLGLPIQYGLLVWKAIAVVMLWLGVSLYANRFFKNRAERFGSALIALFYVSPLLAASASVLNRQGFPPFLIFLSYEPFTSFGLWGYAPSALATSLMPIYALTVTKELQGALSLQPEGARALALSSFLGFMISWLHPWQGASLVLATTLLGLSYCSFDALLRVARPILFALAPLLGYAMLARIDPAWANTNSVLSPELADRLHVLPNSWKILAFLFAPLIAAGVFGFRSPGHDPAERFLLLWPLAALIAFHVVPAVSWHSLGGIVIPLAVVATRGLARAPSRFVSASIVILLTLPGYLYLCSVTASDLIHLGTSQAHVLAPGEVQALSYLEQRRDNAGVLATPFLASAVPAWTGHPVWAGHPMWTPTWDNRLQSLYRLSAGALTKDEATGLVRSSGTKYVLSGCNTADLSSSLSPIVARTESFGCATVYELK